MQLLMRIATACMVMGKDKAIEFLDLHPEFDAYLIYSDENGNFQTWISENLKDHISRPENKLRKSKIMIYESASSTA
ncbi:MAG: FAD:protein FMN transferase [Marinilabiliales bacterium]|nr:FAD:protein FMN transferase [Marinilabiliales bacterium]